MLLLSSLCYSSSVHELLYLLVRSAQYATTVSLEVAGCKLEFPSSSSACDLGISHVGVQTPDGSKKQK